MDNKITIQEFKDDRNILQNKIVSLLKEFEDKYGQEIITNMSIRRWNGSNYASGPISILDIQVKL